LCTHPHKYAVERHNNYAKPMGGSVGRRIKPCKPIRNLRIDKREPKTQFLPVDTTPHDQRFQKSPLWPKFLEIVVFSDKN